MGEYEKIRDKFIIYCLGMILITVVCVLGLKIVIQSDKATVYREQINVLEIKNRELIQACELSDVLRQLIPPQAWDELKLVAEELKQRKTKIK